MDANKIKLKMIRTDPGIVNSPFAKNYISIMAIDKNSFNSIKIKRNQIELCRIPITKFGATTQGIQILLKHFYQN